MKMQELHPTIDAIAQERLGRRRFLSKAGIAGLGAAATAITLGSAKEAHASPSQQSADTVQEIFTAALIAEDLATTFYYNALVGPVIQDPNLAGPGGSATDVTSAGNLGNVEYVQAALSEEISHANLFRSLLGISSPAADPVQTFYFPAGTFNTLGAFTGLLNALENAFIGAYLVAIEEFAFKAWHVEKDGYTSGELQYFAQVAASIMGIEAEHRVLGRVISNTNPANNLAYEQLDGLNALYNGPKSAAAALTPFLSNTSWEPYSLATALAGASSVSVPVTGNPPAF